MDFNIEDITKGSGEEAADEVTSTGIFDVPESATTGAKLQIDDAGTKYTIDLGL